MFASLIIIVIIILLSLPASKNESLSSMSSSTNSLQQSVSVRDSEIIRLHRLLDGGRPEAAVDAAAREDSMQKMVIFFRYCLELERDSNVQNVLKNREKR